MNDFHFIHGAVIVSLLLTLPATAFLWWMSFRLAQGVRDAYGERRLLTRFADQMTLRKQAPRVVLCLLVVLMLTLTAAGPATKSVPEHVKAGSMQVVVVFNVDPGMAAEDYRGEIPGEGGKGPQGTRLQEAEWQVESSLMPAIQGNQLGFVTNMGGAFVQANLTDDFTSLRFILDNNWIKAGMDDTGTDIGDAPCCGDNIAKGLIAAVQTFQRSGVNSGQRVIVYFGDGGFTASDAEIAKAMQMVNAAHIRLIVVGDGKDAPIAVPIYDSNGNKTGVVKFNNKTAYSTFDETRLKQLAALSGNSQYIRITSGSQHINWPSAVSGADKTQMVDDDFYWVPLSIAMLLLVYLSLPGGYDPRRRLRRRHERGS